MSHLNMQEAVLADDDNDDRILFKDVIRELQLPVQVTLVNDGERLMKHLVELKGRLPDVLFLDLNMPRKNGFTCLAEIKSHNALSSIPVVIISTSYDVHVAELLYKKGAHYYIRKPADYSELKYVINHVFLLLKQDKLQPPFERFLISNTTTS